jgi:hypothetical protein
MSVAESANSAVDATAVSQNCRVSGYRLAAVAQTSAENPARSNTRLRDVDHTVRSDGTGLSG